MLRRIALVVIALACLAGSMSTPSTYADATAMLTGRIVDPGGLAVPDVKVEVVNLATGVQQSTVTNGDGYYSIPALSPSTYSVTVEKAGFKQVVKTDVTLHVEEVVSVNFSLQIGSMTETVTVNGGGVNINTTDASVSTVIDRNFAENLPLNGRSFNTLLQLTPGTVVAPTNGLSPGQFSFNGVRTNGNYFLVDGVSANFGVNDSGNLGESGAGSSQAFNAFGGTSSLVSVDAMQEFRVLTSTFAPEYGHAPGGQVIIETRSGANAFHGDVFDYFRNNVLDANDWFANTLPGKPQAAERQNDFGGVFGGPILKDRTFFFFSYEGLRLRQPQTTRITVPSASIRTATTTVASAVPYLDAFPLPNGTDFGNGLAQFTGTYSNQAVMDAASLRIDHHFRGNWSLFGRYNYAPSKLGARTFGLSEFDTTTTDTTTATVGLTGVLTPAITESFRANYSTQKAGLNQQLDSFGGAVPLAANLLLPSPLSASAGQAEFGLFDGSVYFLGQSSKNRETQVALLDDITTNTGSHQLKYGFDYRQLRLKQAPLDGNLIYLAFSTQGFASNGMVNIIANIPHLGAATRFHALSFYGQDAWKASRKLTVTYGLRWEFDPAPSGYDGTIFAAWTNVDNPASTALAAPGTPVWKNTYTNFAPRAGVAYRLTENGDFVIRGGWGIFYDSGTSVVPQLGIAYPNGGSFEEVCFTFPCAVATPTSLPLANVGPPVTPVLPLSTQCTPATEPCYTGFLILGFSPDLQLPRSYQWNVALEKSFAQHNVLSLTYLDQRGRNLLRQEGEPQPNSNFAAGTTFQIVDNRDISDYHALQLQFRRPLAQRLQALLNYTWSHSIDTASEDATTGVFHGALSPSTERGNSDFDVRHSFSGAMTYDVPGAGSGLLGGITKNWFLDTVVEARTGFPINVTTQSVTIPGVSPATPTRPDRVPGVPFWLTGAQCVALYVSCPGGRGLNPAAFDVLTPGAAGRQGTLGRNAISGFGFTQVDLSAGRKFPLTEKVTLQFRADLFNVLNHPNFADPDSNIDHAGATFGVAGAMLNQGLGGLNALYQQGGPRSTQLSLKLQF